MKVFTMNSMLVLVMNIIRMEHKESFAQAADRAGIPGFLMEETMCGGIPLEAMAFKRFCKGYKADEDAVVKAAEYIRDTFHLQREWQEGFYWKHDELATKLQHFRTHPNYKDHMYLSRRNSVGFPFILNFSVKFTEYKHEHDMLQFGRIFS